MTSDARTFLLREETRFRFWLGRAGLFLVVACLAIGCCTPDGPAMAGAASLDTPIGAVEPCLILPGPTNAVRFLLYTNAASASPHLFNTFSLEAFGEVLLRSPGGGALQRGLNAASNAAPHQLLVNGTGPDLNAANGMTIIEQASGPDWCFVALDASAAYQRQLHSYTRGILFVEPNLFVLHDHLVAKEPSMIQMILHAPAATRIDKDWKDLRLELPEAGLRIHAPAPQKQVRGWRQIESAADQLFPGTITMELGPTNRVTELNLLTVFAVHPADKRGDFAFRLLQGSNAIGARIHRDGLPTLVAFRLDAGGGKSSLTGFEFTGPVGVSVYRPKNLR